MTDDLSERQRRALDIADDSPADATEADLDALLSLTRYHDSGVRADAAQAVSTLTANQPDLVAARLPDAIDLLYSLDVDVRMFGQDVVRFLGSERPGALGEPRRCATSHRG